MSGDVRQRVAPNFFLGNLFDEDSDDDSEEEQAEPFKGGDEGAPLLPYEQVASSPDATAKVELKERPWGHGGDDEAAPANALPLEGARPKDSSRSADEYTRSWIAPQSSRARGESAAATTAPKTSRGRRGITLALPTALKLPRLPATKQQ